MAAGSDGYHSQNGRVFLMGLKINIVLSIRIDVSTSTTGLCTWSLEYNAIAQIRKRSKIVKGEGIRTLALKVNNLPLLRTGATSLQDHL